MATALSPASRGGKALLEKYGIDHMKRIGAEGGHTTVSRYGTGYMAQIGSAGGLRRQIALRAERTHTADEYEFDRYMFEEEAALARIDPPQTMDKQEILDFLVNRRFVTEEEAKDLMELSIKEIRGIYDGHAFGEPAAPSTGSSRSFQEADDFYVPDSELIDDDADEPFDLAYDRGFTKIRRCPFPYTSDTLRDALWAYNGKWASRVAGGSSGAFDERRNCP